MRARYAPHSSRPLAREDMDELGDARLQNLVSLQQRDERWNHAFFGDHKLRATGCQGSKFCRSRKHHATSWDCWCTSADSSFADERRKP